jgi:segregation and condensation protein A
VVTTTLEYRVRLEAFEGPLDLLLYLIRQHEVEITDIPIARIADQYMAFLQIGGGLDRIDMDLAGEFLVMACTLMEIKSRMLTPRPTALGEADPLESDGDAIDPRADLVRQLLAYKRYRDAADLLESRRQEWERRYPSAPTAFSEADEDRLRDALARADDLELEDVSLSDLLEAFQRIVAAVNFDRLGDHTVIVDDTPIELHAQDILDRLRRVRDEIGALSHPSEKSRENADHGGALGGGLALQSIFAGRRRGEMLGLFLATLELVRRREVSLRQDSPGVGGEIWLTLAEEEGGWLGSSAPRPSVDHEMPIVEVPRPLTAGTARPSASAPT